MTQGIFTPTPGRETGKRRFRRPLSMLVMLIPAAVLVLVFFDSRTTTHFEGSMFSAFPTVVKATRPLWESLAMTLKGAVSKDLLPMWPPFLIGLLAWFRPHTRFIMPLLVAGSVCSLFILRKAVIGFCLFK